MQRNRRSQLGLSLVEPLVTGTIASVLAVSALSGLEQAKDRQRLESAAAQIESELQYARSSAVARGETVRALFRSTTGGSCYVIHNGQPGDCTCQADGRTQCAAGVEVLRSVGFAVDSGLSLSSTAREVGFGSDHGTVTPTTTLQLQNRGGDSMRLVLNVMGRIRSCTVGTSSPHLASC